MFLILLALCVLAVSAAGLGLLAFARPTPATTRLADLFGPLGAACGCALGMAGLFTDSWTGSLLWTQAWGLPVGSLSLGLDALSRVFLLPVFGLGFVCACAGGISLRHTRASEHNLAAHWLFYLLLVLGMAVVMMARDAVLFLLARRQLNRAGGLPGTPLRPRALDRRIAAIALPIGMTALLGNLMGSANAVLIPQRLVAAGAQVSEAMSAFGVLCGMTIPMLYLPTAFIGALGLVLVPKLAESTALGRSGQVQRRVDRSMLATSVLILPCMAILVVLGPTIGVYLFREPTVGEYILPLSVGVLCSCYQSVLSGALNGVGRQSAAARNSILCGVVQLGCTFFLMGLPGVGLRGYVAGFVASAVLGMLLNWLQVRKATGLRLQIFQWCTAPALSAVLMALVVNLLFHVLLDAGLDGRWAVAACIAFGAVLYLAALQAQGVHLRRLFRLHG